MPRGLLPWALGLLTAGCAIPIIGARGAERAFDARSAGEGSAKPGLTLRVAQPDVPHSADACFQQLSASGVAYERVAPDEAHGVTMPLRLSGPIGGVRVWPRSGADVHAILDCRLALRLLSWAPSLRRAGVTGLEHYSIYRPGARVGGRGKISGHARGLAIDAARFHLDGGSVVDVLTDWEERDRGEAPCPRRADEPGRSQLLRGVVCEAVDRRLFSVVLTPHADRAHGNHVHLELKPDVSWTYVR